MKNRISSLAAAAFFVLAGAFFYAQNALPQTKPFPTNIASYQGYFAGGVNKIRNASVDIWQRGTSVTTSSGYTADGYIVNSTGASVTAQAAITNGATYSGGPNPYQALQIVGNTGVTSVIVSQRIESYLASPLAGQQVTVYAAINNGTGGNFTPTLTVKYPATQDGWGGTVTTLVNAVSFQTAVNGGWGFIAYTFAAPINVTNGMGITFGLGNNFSTNAKLFTITAIDVRATPGIATGINNNPAPPELRPIGTEMPLNQRYFYAYSTQVVGIALGANAISQATTYPTTMRTAPTFSNGSFTASTGNNGTFSTPLDIGVNSAYLQNSGSSWTTNAIIEATFNASSEL